MANKLPIEERYEPSNGTDGDAFEYAFCSHCIHEKWMHTQNDKDKKCDILNRALIEDIKSDDYPEEWTYVNNKPVCTAHVNWNWGNNDDDTGLNEPPIIEPDDPNQLVMPFEIEGIIKEIPVLI